MSKRENLLTPRSPGEAARLVVVAESEIAVIPMIPGIKDEILDNINMAFTTRRDHGLMVDSGSREEVFGLVNAAMGDYQHMVDLRRSFNKYVVGLAQTDPITLDFARQSIT